MERKYKLGLSLIIISIIISAGFLYNSYWLVIKEAETGKIIWEQEVNSKTEFAVKYHHSVQQTPVWEYYKVVDSQLYLTGTRYESYGAGLPFLPKNNYTVDQEGFKITGINRKLSKVPIRVSDYARHRFIINGQTYKLYKLTEPQNLVLIQVDKRNYFDSLVGGENNG